MHKIAPLVWLISALILLPLTSAHANKLYKWTDESGQVHYSQTPPTTGKATEMEMPKSVIREPVQAKPDEAKREENDPVARFREVRQQNCQIARQNLQIYRESEVVQQPDGKMLELDDDTRQANIAEAEAMIQEFCN
jgi:hypothetical protein